MSSDDASISTLTQRFRFLDLVQKIARADVDQCVATVGLESLHGMSLLTSHRTKNHQADGNEENQQPSHIKTPSRDANVKNGNKTSTSKTTTKTSSHSTETTNKNKNAKILPQQPQQHSHVHTETHKHHYHYPPNNSKNNVSASSDSDSTTHLHPSDISAAKKKETVKNNQKPLDAETAATIASRAAHEAAAAVLDEIRLHHQQQQQQQSNINYMNNKRQHHHHHHHNQNNNDPSTISPSRNNQQQPQLRTEETDSSPISFRTDGLVVPVNNTKPTNPLSSIRNNQQLGNRRIATHDNNKFETSSVKSDREIAVDAAADRLAKMMMMEEEQDEGAENVNEQEKSKRQESRSSSVCGQNKPKNNSDTVLPNSSSVTGANSKRPSPDPVDQEQQRQERKKSPVTFADQNPSTSSDANKNLENSAASTGNSNNKIPVDLSQIIREQMEKQNNNNNKEVIESSRRSASSSSNRKHDDHLEIDSISSPVGHDKNKNTNSSNRATSDAKNNSNAVIIPLHVSAAISDFIDHTDITKRQHRAQQSFSTSSNKNSNTLSPEERVALFNEIEDEQRTQKQKQNQNAFSPNLLISQLDEWLSKHDSFINANVGRHLAEAEHAETKYAQRQKRERENEEEELQKYQQKIWAEELSGGGGGEVSEGETLLSGEAERKTSSKNGNLNEEEKRNHRRLEYPRGHVPSDVCATLREAGKKIPVIVKNWRMQSSLTSSSDLPSEVFCERMAEQMLLSLFNDVGGEVDQLFDEFVEGLVEHELS